MQGEQGCPGILTLEEVAGVGHIGKYPALMLAGAASCLAAEQEQEEWEPVSRMLRGGKPLGKWMRWDKPTRFCACVLLESPGNPPARRQLGETRTRVCSPQIGMSVNAFGQLVETL